MAVAHTPTKIVENFREVDWDKFRTTLKAEMSQLGLAGPITSQSELDEDCEKLTRALQDTISAEVPTSIICPKSKRWWTKELTTLRRNANKLGRKVSKLNCGPGHTLFKEYEEAKRVYAREIERNKRQHWRDWLEKASEPDIWTAHKYISAASLDGNNTRIPTLKLKTGESEETAVSNEEKGRMLVRTFFPTGNARPEPVSVQDEKIEPACEWDNITRDQIKKHIAKLKPYKAPGPDGIPNIVLTKCADLLLDRLYYIFKAMIEKGFFYKSWKKFTTVVLRKPGKANYSIPKAYRPIALINTQVKLLTAVLADQLMYYAEKYNLLPKHHYGGRKGRNTTDAVQMLVHRIKKEWRKGNVVSVLFLDIEGAFPNADNERLIANLTKRKIPPVLITFIANMLKDRSTVLKFDGFTSDTITLNNGIGQGDPLSMALYQFYNADILDIPEGKHEEAMAYVDDTILITSGPNFQDTHDKLHAMMTRNGGAINWAEKHNSHFEYNKLALIDFAHSSKSKSIVRMPLELPNCTIKPSESTKYLGIMLDQGLKWKEQEAYVVGKGTKWAAQIRRIARPSWGLTPRSAKKLYIGVAIPRILYGVEVWHHPKRKTRSGEQPKGTPSHKLATTQRQGALAITGGFRTSPSDALDAHAALVPMKHKLDVIKHSKVVRMASLPSTHPLHTQIRTAARRYVRRHRLPLHELAASLARDPDDIETIPTVSTNPTHKNNTPFQVSIPEDKEASIRESRLAREEIKVYTDGSIHNGKVGAAAVMYRGGKRQKTLKLCIGESSEHTVYEAELVGLILGLQLIKMAKRGKVKCALGADNQAAIKALQSELTKPGQHLAAKFLRLAKQVSKSRGGQSRQSGSSYGLVVRWTAGHCGIKGNEVADGEAKNAAEGNSSPLTDIPRYIRSNIKQSISALKQQCKQEVKDHWKMEWNESERFKRFKAPDIVTPSSQKFLELISDHRLPRHMASRIFQLRVGHSPLNTYLHRFGIVDSARCPACGAARETTEHYVLRCPKYAHERWALLRHIKDNDPKVEHVLAEPKAIVPLANFIDATERFKAQGAPSV